MSADSPGLSRVPAIGEEGRAGTLWLIAALGIGQAVALGVVAFATRGAFSALAAGAFPAPRTLLLLVTGGLAVVALRLVSRIEAEALGQAFAASLRHRLYRHIAGMDRRALSERRLGGLSLRFVGDLTAAQAWAGKGLAPAISAAFVLPGTAAAMAILNLPLAIAGLVPMLLPLGIAAILTGGLARRHLAMRRRRSAIAMSMMERVALAPELDIADRTGRELERLDKASVTLRDEAVTRRGRTETLRALPHVGAALGGAAILWTTARLGMPPADAAAALAILSILTGPLVDLADVSDRWFGWQVARDACERLFALPSQPRDVHPRGGAVPVTGHLTLPGGAEVALDVPAGALAVISGAPGSGKSVLARIIGGQDRAEAGDLAYGDGDDSLPRIATIETSPLILKGSLRRALTLGIEPRPKPKQIHTTAREFGLGPVLDRLGTTKARLSEGGAELSLSEQLSVGLARAALMAPDLIVIDHPAVGPATAGLIRQLHERSGATLIVVAPGDLFAGAEVIRLPQPEAAGAA